MQTSERPPILNVNDAPGARYTISRMLRTAGHDVIEAGTGRQALEILARAPRPLVMVTDVRLPDVDGLTICRRVKADPETAALKVILTSATFVTPDRKVMGLEAGADAYLIQPFERMELIATVESLLRLSEVEQELRDRMERLSDTDRRKDEFIAMLGHELRNPLAAITSALDMLSPASDEHPLERRAREVVERQCRQLTRLVDDLLEVGRITRGRIELRAAPLDLGVVAAQIVRGLTDEGVTRDRAVVLSSPHAPLWIDADEARIRQILVNLVENAVKHTAPAGSIRVEVRAADGESGALRWAELSVRDDGEGIDPAALPYLFDPFFQAAPTIDRRRGGLGLGLALTQRLAALHGGSCVARSEGRGRGAELVVRFPLRSAPPDPGTEPIEGALAEPIEPLRVLLVEDHRDVGETLRDLLTVWGHAVGLAHDGPSALELAARDEHDVALVDLGLPGLDGYTVARRLRTLPTARSLVLVAITGYGSHDDRRAREAGFVEQLVKPVQATALRGLLRRVRDRV